MIFWGSRSEKSTWDRLMSTLFCLQHHFSWAREPKDAPQTDSGRFSVVSSKTRRRNERRHSLDICKHVLPTRIRPCTDTITPQPHALHANNDVLRPIQALNHVHSYDPETTHTRTHMHYTHYSHTMIYWMLLSTCLHAFDHLLLQTATLWNYKLITQIITKKQI